MSNHADSRCAVGVVIHHLSDVHAGESHDVQAGVLVQPWDPVARLAQYKAYLEQMSHQRKPLPDLVVLSGDLVSRGENISEFVSATKILQQICSYLAEEKGPGVRMCVVPGNHDLDWSKSDYQGKIENYRTYLSAVPRHSVCVLEVSDQPWFIIPGTNVLVYLLNTCPIGGTIHPLLKQIHGQLERLEAPSATLDDLKREARLDPGYVARECFAEMGRQLPTGHADLLKIAVMHHNPSPMPKDWVDRFTTIVNAGRVKTTLEEHGFDLILHGHQHQMNCTYEEFLGGDGTRAQNDGSCGLYVLGAPTLGAKDRNSEPGWLQLTLENADNAHRPEIPSSRVTVHRAASAGGTYQLSPNAAYRFSIGKPLFANMRLLHERLGRGRAEVGEERRTRDAIDLVLSPLLRLRDEIDDWGDGTTWDDAFHQDLEVYCAVYGIDRLGPASWLNARYLYYVLEQFRHASPTSPQPAWSSDVAAAIQRTGWAQAASPPHVAERGAGLELARVLLWTPQQCSGAFARATLRVIDSLHQLFNVPAFVLHPRNDAAHPTSINEEFVLGVEDRGAGHQRIKCYVFALGGDGRTRLARNGSDYLERFRSFLNDPGLMTIPQVLADPLHRAQHAPAPGERP